MSFDDYGNAIVGNVAIPASHVPAFRALLADQSDSVTIPRDLHSELCARPRAVRPATADRENLARWLYENSDVGTPLTDERGNITGPRPWEWLSPESMDHYRTKADRLFASGVIVPARVAETGPEELIAQIVEIVNRGNVVPEWPDDEAAAYRDNDGFSEGRAAVDRLRATKIIGMIAPITHAAATNEGR